MGLKKRGKSFASKAKLALATAGLSSCVGCGADPPARPIDCTTVQDGSDLIPEALLTGDQLRVRFTSTAYGSSGFLDTSLTDLVGATVLNGGGNEYFLQIAPGVTSGSFRFAGTTLGYPTCAFARTFTFQIAGSDGGAPTVHVAERAPLPLDARDQATIVVLAAHGDEALVEARTTFGGAWHPKWDVSAGEIVSVEGSRMRWRLPAGSGLHRVEVVLDYGDHGLSFDALSLERG